MQEQTGLLPTSLHWLFGPQGVGVHAALFPRTVIVQNAFGSTRAVRITSVIRRTDARNSLTLLTTFRIGSTRMRIACDAILISNFNMWRKRHKIVKNANWNTGRRSGVQSELEANASKLRRDITIYHGTGRWHIVDWNENCKNRCYLRWEHLRGTARHLAGPTKTSRWSSK